MKNLFPSYCAPLPALVLLILCSLPFNGQTWTPLTSPTTDHLLYIDFVDDNHGVVSGYNASPEIWYTNDGGTTWSDAQIPDPGFDPSDIRMAAPGTLIATGTDNGIGQFWYSVDGGQVWTDYTPNIFPNGGGKTLPISGTRFLVANNDGTVYESLANGNNWTTLQSQLPLDQVGAAEQVGNRLFFAGMWTIPQTFISKIMLLYSHDNGANWDTVEVSRYGIPQAMDFVSPDTGFILTNNALFKTVDGGLTWNPEPTNIAQPFYQGMAMQSSTLGFLSLTNEIALRNGGSSFALDLNDPNLVFRNISFPGNNAYVCGNDGLIMKRAVLNGQDEPLPPTAISLYPNPVNHNRLTIETQHRGAFSLMDAYGREVLSGELFPGTTQVSTARFSNGVYLFRWIQNGQTFSRKIQLLR